ncbi:hypothetical protein PV327_002533 [Microctonus hyperodae]|uniref:PH domain-containing protein n=1 Tax=Microctonus hyperodae TaxID=165561 RepID=A0AA39FFX0_MICHY|nr:hypothetical protein PV327_002533 [Microctonus hyperodae]
MSTMEGSLSKWTNVVNGWQYRWFVLDDNAGLLSYYTSKEKMMRGARRGCVRLRGAVIGIDDEDDSTFTITTSSLKDDPKTFHFQTRDGEERERWVRALEDTILRHSHARWDPKKSLPKHDFDRKVAEADAYLQLLIDQIKLLENKQCNLRDDEEERKEKYSTILIQASTVLNSVKHTIVQLQIAKNTAIPVNGIYNGPANENNTHVPLTMQHVPAREPESSVQTGIELGSECIEPRVPDLSNARNLLVPEFSYSSSDEDEDYYDAADDIATPSTTQSHFQNRHDAGSNHSQTLQDQVSFDGRKQQPQSPPTKVDGSVDYDALYEEESEPEMDSMESHGSVVTHLLSQVKIGMDLTKVALPTFILERRSLLEMYADYFAHPKHFVSAFYAEHRAKKISFNAHVWTKSKFLGLSIGVHNIGKGWVNVLEHGEEYVLTFPNGYGRSILTVPWIELGGGTTITCAQTGYQATIEFITKPFYGGKRNRITCQITQPGEKKPFLTINGEWSGIMEAKYSDGRTELFADVAEIPVDKKLVKPVSEQDENESRKVWREVTVGLKINDMDKATAAKCLIEQKQRDEARLRKESNDTWETKFFKETKDGGWAYISPLANRLRAPCNTVQ